MKTAISMFMTIVLVTFFSATGFAQIASTTNPAKKVSTVQTAPQGKFVDANKNGICDNHELKGSGQQGKNFLDKNGDGKCDNQGKNGKGKGNCCGTGQGNGNCCGKGMGNGNGCGFGPSGGKGCGNGHQHRNGCAGQNNSTTPQPSK